MKQLILIYNKFSEVNSVKRDIMKNTVEHFLKMDRNTVKKILQEVCSDFNVVARVKSTLLMTQVYASLDIPRLPDLRVGPPSSLN